jgi:hypothetical protein
MGRATYPAASVPNDSNRATLSPTPAKNTWLNTMLAAVA